MAQRKTKKLLTAAVGVATVSYVVACGRTSPGSGRDGRPVAGTDSSSTTQGMPPGPGTISGNLVAPPDVEPPPPTPPNSGVISGNLVAPPVVDPPPTLPEDTGIISGNLVAPPYPTETVDPDITSTQAQTEDVTSGLIAGNLVAPPDLTDTSEPTPTSETSITPPMNEPDAQSPQVDAAVDAGSGQ